MRNMRVFRNYRNTIRYFLSDDKEHLFRYKWFELLNVIFLVFMPFCKQFALYSELVTHHSKGLTCHSNTKPCSSKGFTPHSRQKSNHSKGSGHHSKKKAGRSNPMSCHS